MYISKILNFQESTTIFKCLYKKKSGTLLKTPHVYAQDMLDDNTIHSSIFRSQQIFSKCLQILLKTERIKNTL